MLKPSKAEALFFSEEGTHILLRIRRLCKIQVRKKNNTKLLFLCISAVKSQCRVTWARRKSLCNDANDFELSVSQNPLKHRTEFASEET